MIYIPNTSTSNKSFNENNKDTKATFSIKETNRDEIYESIIKLDKNKGPGIDDLNVKCLKFVADLISPHLCILFNESVLKHEYPKIFKTAKCVPIYKGCNLDPLEPESYRPISILNALNKVYEKIIHEQIYKYLETEKLLPEFQYGFRKNHNTSQAILDYVNTIHKNSKINQVSIAIFMDLSKAFDTVNKQILSTKLTRLGFDTNSRDLLINYMTDRQFVFPNDPNTIYTLDEGIPQGSILGPLLFIIYTYDIKYVSVHNKIIVYADDTTAIVSGRNFREAIEKGNDILQRFLDYFNLNKLSINLIKTKCMIYGPKTMKHGQKKDTILMMDGEEIEEVSEIKFLGIIINNKLSWEKHKLYVNRKVSQSLGIIYNCKKVMSEEEVINIYKTFSQSNPLYVIEVWGHSIKSENDILIKAQNKVLRMIFDCKRSNDAWRH